MNEIGNILNWYNSEYYQTYNVANLQWNDRDAVDFLKTYFISEEEYESKWKRRQEEVFSDINVRFPEMVFASKLKILPMDIDCLFEKRYFSAFMGFLECINEREFIIIQRRIESEPQFRFKFPITISWEQINSGSFISSTLLYMPHYQYYLFGSSDTWGSYVDCEHYPQISFIGVLKQHESLIMPKFKNFIYEEIYGSLPKKYLDRT